MTGSSVDVVVVQKRTALERYASEFISESGRTYFLRDGQTDQTLYKAHDAHCQTLDTLLTYLTQQKISFALKTLDDLSAEASAGLNYYRHGQASGLASKLNLTISVGGDGTLLRASHFVGGKGSLVGLNSVPQHSVGHLCSLFPERLERGIAEILNKTKKPTLVRRLVCRVSTGESLPYALNDVYFGHQHPASASRYRLLIEGPHAREEKQLSSGVWIASPAGSTAAIRSYGLGSLELTEKKFLFAVREPYAQIGHTVSLSKLVLDGDHESLTLFSRMRNGIVCIDGPMIACALGFGDSLEIGLGPEGALQLYI